MKEEKRKPGHKTEYRMITSLSREEVVRRLKNATVLRGEWVSYQNRKKYPFYGKVDDKGFVLRINSSRLLPSLDRNSVFQRWVYGTITTSDNGKSIIFFRVKKQNHWFTTMFAVVLLISGFVAEPGDAFVGVFGLVWGGIILLGERSWKDIERCAVEQLEELWEAEKVV